MKVLFQDHLRLARGDYHIAEKISATIDRPPAAIDFSPKSQSWHASNIKPYDSNHRKTHHFNMINNPPRLTH